MLGSNIPMVLPEGQDLPDTIYCMACQAATLCSPDLFLDILEFCKYISFACEIYAKCQMEDFGFIPQATCLDTNKDPYGDWTFEDFFTEDGAVLDTPAVLPFAYKIASSLVPLAGRELLDEGQQCCKRSPARQALGYPLRNSLVLQTGKLPLWNLPACRTVRSNKVLQDDVFNSHHVDHQLAFGYCTLLPRAVIFGKLWDIVNQTSQNYKKILAVAIVGTQLALHYEDPQEKQAFGDLVVDAEWGIELGKLGVRKQESLKAFLAKLSADLGVFVGKISFQNIFRTPSVRKKELLRTLVQHPKADPSLILKFCRTFHLGTDAPLQLYIETQFQDAGRGKGESEQGAGKEPHVLAVARAVETIPLLSSTTGLVTSLSAMLHKANMLLKHLKSYKRSSPPGDLEQQFLFDQGLRLSPAAQTRLPFHLIFFKTSQCFWKIISAEINQESFPKLLLICKVMKVSLDNLHVSALNHIFRELKPKLVAATTSGQLWPLDKRTEEIMQADESREKAQVHLRRLQGQHKKAAMEAILAAQKLNSEDHQKLLGKPTNLILKLYQHGSIAERIQNPTGRDYPDIHAAAREIAQINNLELKKIWDTLLERWLCPNVLPTGVSSASSVWLARCSEVVPRTAPSGLLD
ncbi:Kinetochore-associated protein 1, partial [Ophiophagus hannah]